MPDIEIKRGYEVLPDNNIRFGIRVVNSSDSSISDVAVILDYSESLFELEGNKIQKLGNIPPTVLRTAKFILKPLGCIHKEEIGATVRYKDYQWNTHTEEMRPKEIHCVCPFLKEKSINRAEFLALSSSGFFEERGVNFENITYEKLVEFLSHTCKNRLYKVDEFPIDNGKVLYLASDAVGEKAYYLLTAVVKEYEGVVQVLLRANSDKSYGLNGFLNEILENLRHLVQTVQAAREIGVIKKEQVINIINSVVQRTSFGGGEGVASANIRDSVVQRTETKEDEDRKRREQERIRKEREEQERLRRQREEEERKNREEQERLRREEVELKERERKAREETERKAREDAARREQEVQKGRQEEERHRKQREEKEHVEKERKELRAGEKVKRTSLIKILAVAVVVGAVLLGYWAIALHRTDGPDSFESTPIPTPEITPVAIITSTSDQKNFTNSIGMEFVKIPAGEFDMGSPANEKYRYGDEGPVHRVKIAKAFYMGKYEVTQKQWFDVMGNNPSIFRGDDLPVENVSWNDVQEFIKKLNQKEGTDKYRLPSEAEWEYTARAGTATSYSFGDDESRLGDYAWYSENSNGETHPVGQKKPNPWGLYDMHGNVWEWVQDLYHAGYNGSPSDGSAWESGNSTNYVNRGGSYYGEGDGLWRSANRDFDVPGRLWDDLGFRVVRDL